MPKKPIDYSKCCIYKIEHIENESIVYVGHTTNFDKRKGDHKKNSKNDTGKAFYLKLYQMIRKMVVGMILRCLKLKNIRVMTDEKQKKEKTKL